MQQKYKRSLSRQSIMHFVTNTLKTKVINSSWFLNLPDHKKTLQSRLIITEIKVVTKKILGFTLAEYGLVKSTFEIGGHKVEVDAKISVSDIKLLKQK